MITIVDATPEHLTAMGHPPSFIQQGSPGWAALSDGEPCAAGGIMRLWEGRGYCWFVSADPALRDWIDITGAVRKACDSALADGFRRLEMLVDARDKRAMRWAEKLGFFREFDKPHERMCTDGAPMWSFVRFS